MIVDSLQLPVITKAVKCLESQPVEDAYTHSLIAYAFSLIEYNATSASGPSMTRILHKLDSLAVVASVY